MSTTALAVVGATGVALYAGHHVGDYWVQTDHQAAHKGDAGREGAVQCMTHVAGVVAAQAVALALLSGATGWVAPWWAGVLALMVSGVTHYVADRREHGLMFRLMWAIKGKDSPFTLLGLPRPPRVVEAWFDCASCQGGGSGGQAADESTGGRCWDCRGGGKLPSALTISDNPSLGTGRWALDQSWHIALGVFLPALIFGWAA